MWAVLYDDGTSLTTVSEPIANSLAEAERQRGRNVTVRRLDDAAESGPAPEPIHSDGQLARSEPISEPEPALEPEPTFTAEPPPAPEPARTPEPTRTPEPARKPEPARAARPAGRRRLLFYALTAVSIIVAAALAAHWDLLPRVGATTSSSPTQVGSSPHRPQLLAPLNQPPVMHFSSAISARSATRPQSARGESSAGEPSANARGG